MFDFDLVPSLGDSLVFDVSRDDIEDVLDAIIERGSPRSAEKLLTATRKLFNHAIQKRWVKGLAVNPCQHIKLENRQTVSVCLNESEICSFLTKLPDSSIGGDYQQILTLQFLTVSRVSEVAGMAWSEVDLKNKIWTLPAARSKNKQSHRIMLSRQAVTLLKGREKTVTGDFVFPAARSSKPIPGTLVARYMRDKRDYLGIPDGASPHSLRHTAITQLAKMQCGKELRDRISNHKDSSIDAVYQHYEHDTEASKWWQKWANEMDKLKRAKQVEKA
jgi:integrase